MSSTQAIIKRALLSLTSLAVSSNGMSLPASAQMPAVLPPPAHPAHVNSQTHSNAPKFQGEGSGGLSAVLSNGKKVACPLKHTSVSAQVSGNISRVTVKQLFSNPLNDKIEAIYTFPLSDTGAVDDMLMRVGQRTIHGTIKKKEEAREIYNQAKATGHVAALLDQERTNIFTQSVANIEPHKDVEVTISYVDQLPYEAGTYTFAFPTVVGPRFKPPSVSDQEKITPLVAKEGTRAGHDISIKVTVASAVPVLGIDSKLHEIETNKKDNEHFQVSLKDKDVIPNKDFVLTWAVASDKVESGCLTNGKNGQGYFNLTIMPPKRPRADQVQPKEMVFLIDCSGSQSGPPLQKCKDVMHYALDHMNDEDTFQVIAFNSRAAELFPHPEKATAASRERARKFIDGLEANGGTWMAPAVEKACAIPADDHRLRVVTFMTDGLVGNDYEIIGMIKKLRGKSRWFSFGTGNSVNRMLIDNIAKAGGGEADYVLLNSEADVVGKKFYDKIASPVLTDVKVNFDGLDVKEVFPKDISDVWAERPLYFTGRYIKPGLGNVTISGYSGGKPYSQTLKIDLPENNSANDVLGSLWARAKVDRLMGEDWLGAQSPQGVNKELKQEIIDTALAHHIMTQYTSFVAVEEKQITKDGKLITVPVPVEQPDGVRQEMTAEDKATMMRQSFGGMVPGGYARGGVGRSTGGRGAGGGGGGGAPAPYALQGGLIPPPPAAFNASPQSSASAPKPMKKTDDSAADSQSKAELSAREQLKATPKASPSYAKVQAAVLNWLNDFHAAATLKVQIEFAKASDLKKAKKIAGLKVESSASNTPTKLNATITREALKELIKNAAVISINTI